MLIWGRFAMYGTPMIFNHLNHRIGKCMKIKLKSGEI